MCCGSMLVLLSVVVLSSVVYRSSQLQSKCTCPPDRVYYNKISCDSTHTVTKATYRGQVEELHCSGVTVVNKELLTSLNSCARIKTMTERNVLAGWAKAGLYPHNRDRVLRKITIPPTLEFLGQTLGRVKQTQSSFQSQA
jgi:hypothetical protein